MRVLWVVTIVLGLLMGGQQVSADQADPAAGPVYIMQNGEEILQRCTNIPQVVMVVRWNPSSVSMEYIEYLDPELCPGDVPAPVFNDVDDPRAMPVFLNNGAVLARCTSTKDTLLVVGWNDEDSRLEYEELASPLICGGEPRFAPPAKG